jgi:hypothetical protein
MTSKRHKELMANQDLCLTPEEIAEGWHFCWDWDGLLIHKDDREAEICSCQE